MSGNMRTCAKCGKQFFGAPGERFCRECAVALIRGDSGKQELVKNFVRDNQGVSAHEVMEKFGVSKKFVRQMFNNKMFDMHTKGTRYPCANCGKMITEGVYCRDCFLILRKEVKHRSERLMYLKGVLSKSTPSGKRNNVVLIVAHDELNLNVVKYILEKGLPGYKISVALNQVGAMNVIHNQNVCLVLLDDVITNAYDGMDILQKLRADEDSKNIPVVMLSSNTDKQNIAVGIRRGATDYIIRPCEPGDLINRVKKNLGLEAAVQSVKNSEIEKDQVDYEFEKTYKILLIDSDDEALRIESDILEKSFPCEILVSSNGIDGLYLLSDPHFEVDLVLVSMNMPFMDGFEFLAFVAKDPNMRRFPMVIMTESENLDKLSGMRNTLAKGYIAKPEFLEEGLDLIERILLGEV